MLYLQNIDKPSLILTFEFKDNKQNIEENNQTNQNRK